MFSDQQGAYHDIKGNKNNNNKILTYILLIRMIIRKK